MITVKMTRREVFEFARAANGAQQVTIGRGEDAGNHRAFAYACGKNFKHALSIDRETDALQRKCFSRDHEFEQYETERRKLCLKYCERGEDKKPVLVEFDEKENRPPEYAMTAENKVAFDGELNDLAKKFELAIARVQAMTAASEAVKEQIVDIVLHVHPYGRVPVKLAGAWLAGIAPMLTGKPDDAPDISDSKLQIPKARARRVAKAKLK